MACKYLDGRTCTVFSGMKAPNRIDMFCEGNNFEDCPRYIFSQNKKTQKPLKPGDVAAHL